jgi:hypothetical protein
MRKNFTGLISGSGLFGQCEKKAESKAPIPTALYTSFCVNF